MRDPYDVAIGVAAFTFTALMSWAAVTPHGDALPLVPEILLVVALVVLLLGHMVKHLGLRLMAVFILTAAGVEWAFEQSNISLGGFIWGDIRYGDLPVLGPHLGSVPIGVPFLMAVILWPTFASVNLLLDGKVVIDPRTLSMPLIMWRCVLYGFVHSWYMFLCNSLAVERGIYHWVGKSRDVAARDFFFGDPTAPRGWAIYVVVEMLAFTLVMLPRFGQERIDRSVRRPLAWSDAAPILFLGVMAAQIYLNGEDRTTGNVVLWTLGFFAALVGYRFAQLMKQQTLGTASQLPSASREGTSG